MFASFISAALIAIFLQNCVFEHGLGSNVLLYASRKKENLIGICSGIVFITTVCSVIMYFVDKLFGNFQMVKFLMPLIYVFAMSVVYVVTILLLWKFAPKIFFSIKKYVHLSVFNATVLGALFLSNVLGGTLPMYIGYGLGTGIGFLLAAYLLYIGTERLNSSLVPAAFRGMPIMIVYVGVLSMSFSAFSGYAS